MQSKFKKWGSKFPKKEVHILTVRNMDEIKNIANALLADYNMKIEIENWTDKEQIMNAFKAKLEPMSLMMQQEQRMKILSEIEQLLNN